MKYHLIINKVDTVDILKHAWIKADYVALLEKFGYEDSGENPLEEELLELLFLAISDFEPEEAAAIVINYKLSHVLNKNQIDQIAHEMLLDKISEEYADIALHHQLFNINQLLHKAYKGTFPNAKATLVDFEITPNIKVTKEVVLKALNATLAKNNVIVRLFQNALAGKEAFDEAESIVWELKATGAHSYRLTTSEYWMSRDEFTESEFDVKVIEFEADDDD